MYISLCIQTTTQYTVWPCLEVFATAAPGSNTAKRACAAADRHVLLVLSQKVGPSFDGGRPLDFPASLAGHQAIAEEVCLPCEILQG